MAGKIYKNSPRLNRAYESGHRAKDLGALQTTNPHVAGTPDYLAWDDGWTGTFQ